MHKSQWIEEHDRDLEYYDRPIVSHGEPVDSMKEYEFSIHYRDEDDEDSCDDYDCHINHFSDD